MRGTRSGTGRHMAPGYVVRPGIIPKSHFLIGGYTSTDENLRGVEPKSPAGRAHNIYYMVCLRCKCFVGNSPRWPPLCPALPPRASAELLR